MKPVAVFRFSPTEGAGHFASFLQARSIPWRLIAVDRGDPIPPDAASFSGLCLMGGPMSVNDPLPWIVPLLALIRDAVAREVPVIGHCLGGQLLAKALGGTVTRNRVKEIGWGWVEAVSPTAGGWLGGIERFEAFHWHGETFSLPAGAIHLLQSPWCDHQAFAVGPHLGLQCHVEMTEAMIRQWCEAWHEEGVAPGASVQTPEEMLTDVAARVAALHQVADRLYARWLAGVVG